MIEPRWTATELQNIGNAIIAFESIVQQWEVDRNIKVSDIMVNLTTMGRGANPVGLISMREKSDTTLQFEAIEVSLTIA